MSLFKNIRVELLVLLIISLNVFISFNLDLGLYNYFKDFNKSLNSVYLKEFFVDITRLGSSSWYFAISIIGVLIFVGLTAYDTQKIKNMYAASDTGEMIGKKAVMGALTLYLDFINLFIMLLRLFGQRR